MSGYKEGKQVRQKSRIYKRESKDRGKTRQGFLLRVTVVKSKEDRKNKVC